MSTALKEIRLYGKLGAQFGRVHYMAVSSPAEAIKALCYQLEGFRQALMDANDQNIGHVVCAGKRQLDKDNLNTLVGNESIRIAPVPVGYKKGGVLNVILGVVLIVAGAIMAYTGVGAAYAPQVMMMGAAMIIGGVAMMLSPQPKLPDMSSDSGKAKSFAGPVNTAAANSPVPIAFGEIMTGSVVVSAGIVASRDANEGQASNLDTSKSSVFIAGNR